MYATGLTNAIDLDFRPDGTLYVLEIAHNGLLAEKPLSTLVKVQPGKTRRWFLVTWSPRRG